MSWNQTLDSNANFKVVLLLSTVHCRWCRRQWTSAYPGALNSATAHCAAVEHPVHLQIISHTMAALVWLLHNSHEWLMWMLRYWRYLSIPPFYGTKFTLTFCYSKTQHIYLTTSWDWVPNLTFKKWMKILQLHTEINMFCTSISLNIKDC